MQELNEAYEVLSDPDLREQYHEVSTPQQNLTLILTHSLCSICKA